MRLFAFGSNGSGQLGIGHLEDVSSPTECLFSKQDQDQDQDPSTDLDRNQTIVKIAAGGNHTLLLTNTGTVYSAGCNTDGRCGPQGTEKENEKEHESTFRPITLNSPNSNPTTIKTFTHISATWSGSLLVSSEPESDKIYIMGSNPRGELGLPPNPTSTSNTITPGTTIPNFPPAGKRVSALASGMAHSVAVLCDGEVWGWGAARKGQIGAAMREEKIVAEPVRIHVGFFARGVVCGREFTVVYGGERGEFVVLGDWGNRWGVLSVPGVFSGGVREGCGSEDLSLGQKEGGIGSQSQSQGESESGCGGARGFVRYPYTGIGASWHGIYVHAAPGDRVSDLGGRDSHLNDTDTESGSVSGSLVAWGRNDRGQLPPSTLPTPMKLAVGSEHALALLEDGRVAAFGWGEHGNCGPDTDQQGNVSGTYNFISLPEGVDEKVIGLGAGCATSWMVVT
jgi:protein ATS1